MKLLLSIAAVSLILGTPTLAQQPPPDETPITLTYGELNALVQARVADALAAAAMRHLSEQVSKHSAAKSAPAVAPPPSQTVPPAPAPGSED